MWAKSSQLGDIKNYGIVYTRSLNEKFVFSLKLVRGSQDKLSFCIDFLNIGLHTLACIIKSLSSLSKV
jgi:hypothetical protein